MPINKSNLMRGTAILAIAAMLAAALFSGAASAATGSNANSPLGIDLNNVNYYDPEQPFLNIFKTSGITHNTPGWSTRTANMQGTSEEAYLQLDANGYPTTLTASSSDPNSPQKFTEVCTGVLIGLPNSNGGKGLPYRAGQYVLLYDGVGTFSFGLDASLVSASQGASGGRDVFNVASPTKNGVWMCITKTDPKNYVRNIRVVKAEEEALLAQGEIFRPGFLQMLKNFSVIRAMQWLEIDSNPPPPGVWADRPQVADAGWGSAHGVPLEVVISLCNTVSADCWVNVPANADDNYITQMATLVHQQLQATQKVYVELSNEVWNGGFPQYQYAVSQGVAQWPGKASGYGANRNWFGMRTAQMCDIWANVWGGDFSRVHCVLGAQAATIPSATLALNCPLWSGAPCYKHHITDVAIAPYVGIYSGNVPAAWTTMDQTTLVNDIFAELGSGGRMVGTFAGGEVKESASWETAYKAALAPYNLPFIGYEGGQSLVAFPRYSDGSAVVEGFIAANRDPRMEPVYTQLLQDWKASGGHVYVLFNDVFAPSQYGEWGLLESFMDTVSPLTSAPPKWQAVQDYIATTPCWWAGCTGTVAETPLSPQDFKAAQ